MNNVKNAISTTMVVTMMGSAISFFRSSAALWFFTIGGSLLSFSKKEAAAFAAASDGFGDETYSVLNRSAPVSAPPAFRAAITSST